MRDGHRQPGDDAELCYAKGAGERAAPVEWSAWREVSWQPSGLGVVSRQAVLDGYLRHRPRVSDLVDDTWYR